MRIVCVPDYTSSGLIRRNTLPARTGSSPTDLESLPLPTAYVRTPLVTSMNFLSCSSDILPARNEISFVASHEMRK